AVAAGAPDVGSVGRARRRRARRDGRAGACARECRSRLAAMVRDGRAGARGEAGAMKPDASRTVYDGKLVDVVLERWGEHEREIVEHPGAVAIVAVDGDDRIVLVRQLREPARKELLELPAGTVDEGGV